MKNLECHLKTFSHKQLLHKLDKLEEENVTLLKFRLNIQFPPNGSICEHHKLKYLDYFTLLQKKCCDPFKKT